MRKTFSPRSPRSADNGRSPQQYEREGQRAGQRLDPEDLAAGGKTAEYAGDDDAAEEKNFDRGSRVTENETPSEPGRDEAVVQALIRCESLRSLGEIRRGAESAKAQGLGPQEHLEDEEPEMQESDHCYRSIGDGCHGTPFPWKTPTRPVSVTRVASRSCGPATRGRYSNASLFVTVAVCCCHGGHFAEPYEQNTQQSPGLGRSIVWHAVHS